MDTPAEADDAHLVGTVPETFVRHALPGASWVAAAMALANLFGYLLNLVASRGLGPAGFGALGALLGAVLIGNVVALGLQAVTARVLAADPAHVRAEAAAMYRQAGWCALGVAVVTALAAPALAGVLHLEDGRPAWLLPLVLGPLTVTGVQLGMLQGTERFRELGVLYVVAAAGKVGGGLAGLGLGGSVTSTMVGTAFGATAAMLVGHGLVRHFEGGGPRPTVTRLPEIMWATHSLLVLFALTNVDVLLARHYLSEVEAGRYAVGAVVTKGAFWLPGFVAVIALPALSDAVRRRRAALLAVLAVGTCGVVVTGVCVVAGGVVVAAVGGSAYASLAPRVWLFALAGSLFALAQLLLYSRLATTDRRALAGVWAAFVLLLVLVMSGRHGSMTEIVSSVVVAAAALVAVGVLAELHEHAFASRAPTADR